MSVEHIELENLSILYCLIRISTAYVFPSFSVSASKDSIRKNRVVTFMADEKKGRLKCRE
jgi:hypothetical protein